MKRTASAQKLIATAKEHTTNLPEVPARLALVVTDGTATGADVAQALSGRTDDLGPLPFSFDPEVARKNV